MSIAMELQRYLEDSHVSYDVTEHKKTSCSSKTAEASHVPGDSLAKGVVLKWNETYLLAIVPATRHVELDKVEEFLDGKVKLASEQEASRLFPDCEEGAIPVMGGAYGVPSIIDELLEDSQEIYFEGGDHRSLVHMSGDEFSYLMCDVPRSQISA
ncbi:MAG: YbaK/EbsC family protein [Rhizobiales bacterium]|nr:YbaK/EbsC family protein [Hyphomicrobiales bacterium]